MSALDKELFPGEPIKFTIGGTEYTLARPLPVSVWSRLFRKLQDDRTDDDDTWFIVNLAGRAEDVVCWLTGLTAEAFREVGKDEHERVLTALAEQIGEEFVDASPFSPSQQARDIALRASKMVAAMGAKAKRAGGESSPAFSVKSAADDGTKPSE